MFSLTTRVALALSLVLCGVASVWFKNRQNRANTSAWGGKISKPKLMWLFFCIWFWLFECAVLAFEPSLPLAIRAVCGAHALSMWLRGGVEMFMLYVTKNWRPPIGIGHNVFCIVTVPLVLVGMGSVGETGAWGPWAWALVGMLVFSLGVETLYAALFFKAVKGQTTGEKGIWFASEDEERFKRINRITTAFNAPQVAFQLALLAVGFSR